MKISNFLTQLFLLLSLLFTSDVLPQAKAFTGTYGINYGRIADNLPTPENVVKLLRAAKIKNVRIFDANHSVLEAFSRTGLELQIGLPNEDVKDISYYPDHALSWVKENVLAFLPDTQIRGIAVGNEVLGGADQSLWPVLLGAAKNLHNATKQLEIDDVIQISTSHSQAVFQNSYPPSNCTFTEDVAKYMKPLLEFFSQIGSPFWLNAYPFLAYTYNPTEIDVNYALFEKNKGIYDEAFGLHYDNMLDAQIDAAYAALEDAGYNRMEVIVTETGWASRGDQNEPAATTSNARTYNFNLRKRLALRKGTPHRPKNMLKAYIFALFNEYQKPGATSERNFGLFKPDGSIAYDIGFPGLKSSSASSFLSLKDIRSQGLSRVYIFVLILCALILLLFRSS